MFQAIHKVATLSVFLLNIAHMLLENQVYKEVKFVNVIFFYLLNLSWYAHHMYSCDSLEILKYALIF